MKTVEIKDVKIGEGIPKICIPLTGKTREEIIKEAEIVKNMEPDLVEWRADCYEEGANSEKRLEMLKTIHDRLDKIPLLFTFRTDKEGGSCPITYADYVNPNYALVTEKFLKNAHQYKLSVMPYTVNEHEQAKVLQKLGVDGLISDNPNDIL